MSSIRQQIAVQKLSEIIGNSKGQKHISMGRILREAGYSNETSKTPQLVTESKGFKKELAKLVPDEVLIKKHTELLNAYKLKTYSFDKRLSNKEISEIIELDGKYNVMDIIRNEGGKKAFCRYWSPDYMVRLSALDMFYKVKNLYPSKKHPNNVAPIILKTINYSK